MYASIKKMFKKMNLFGANFRLFYLFVCTSCENSKFILNYFSWIVKLVIFAYVNYA